MKPYYEDESVTLYHGDALAISGSIPQGSVRAIVTSPPYYGLRDYGDDQQIGAEGTVQEYVDRLVGVFAALRPALTDDGTLWLNLGDSYSSVPGWGRGGGSTLEGTKQDAKGRSSGSTRARAQIAPKNLLGVPWRVALALQEDGWVLRSDIIWSKPNPMPESVTDRPTKAHEYLFLLAKSARYFYDGDAIAEPLAPSSVGRLQQDVASQQGSDRAAGGAKANGPIRAAGDLVSGLRNKRTVWSVPTVSFSGAHFAVYPPELIRPCVLAGSRPGDIVLDPFSGSGTTGMVATQEGRRYVGFDVNADYLDLSLRTRFKQPVLDLTGGAA